MGGGLFAPFIVNLAPTPDQAGSGLTDALRLSIRDIETHVVANLIQIVVGWAQVTADGTEPFETALPRTQFSSLLHGIVDPEKSTIAVVAEGVQITKTLATPQKSTYFTSIDAGTGFEDAMVTAVLEPNVITIGELGAVLGLEHGPRNTAAYMFFDNPSGTPRIRLAGPADSLGVRVPDVSIPFDWTGLERRYVLVWNEISSQVELYAIDETNSLTTILLVEPISSFQSFDTESGQSTPPRGSASELTAVYGIEGAIGDRVTIGNLAVTKDVGFPIIGGARPGNFFTTRRTDETVRYEGGDPRKVDVSSWFGPDDTVFPNPDPAGVVSVPSSGSVQLIKSTANTHVAIHREEPGFLSDNTNGLLLEMEFSGVPTRTINGRMTGMGVMIWDGQSVFMINLIEGDTRTVGLLNPGGDASQVDEHLLPATDIDWATSTKFRFIVDPRRNKVELYSEEDILTPVLSVDFDRSNFPTGADLGVSALPAFIAFGHLSEIDTAGIFELRSLKYSHLYQAYESADDALPNLAPTDPVWVLTTSGFGELNPLFGIHLLGGGFGPTSLPFYIFGGSGPSGSSAMVDDQLVVASLPGQTQVYFRSAPIGPDRGAVIEARLQITDHKPKARTGTMMFIDDGLRSYILSFVDTDIGKFAGVAVRSGLSSFVERVGTDGVPETLSFQVDWDQPHTYRMERRPLDGLYIFVDDAADPVLVIPDSDNVDFPSSQFLAPVVAFGQFSTEGSVSKWDFVRTMFSSGYEISFKKVATTAQLEEDIANAQAIVIAFAEDLDS